MSSTFLTIGVMLIILALAGAVGGRVASTHPTRGAAGAGILHAWWRTLMTAGILLLVLFTVGTFVVIVPAGHVGVVTWFGRVEDRTLSEGLQIVTPIAEQVVLVDVRVQPHGFQEIDAASKEYQTVRLTGTMNYHIDPKMAYDLYRNVGLDFAEKVIDPAFNDFIKEVVPQYPVTAILAEREAIRRLAREALGANLERYHIVVDDIYLANISFGEDYEHAIEQKQVAEQQVQTEKQILEQKRIQADQRVAEAKGDAQATIERAEGQAQANERLAQSLTEPVLTYTYIQKLSDNVQVMMVPGGQQFLLDLKGLVKAPGQ